MVTPKISILFPVYNSGKYIRSSLESLVNQTFPDIEIIAIDDCGTDDSMEIVLEMAGQDSRIKIIRQAENGGLARARNAGLRTASATYIMCCDSDDQYTPEMCKIMYDAIENSGADLAVCGMKIIYETGTEGIKTSDDDYYKIKFRGLKQITDNIKENMDFSACNKIFRYKIIVHNDIEYPEGLYYEDAFFINAYLAVSKNIFFTQDKMYIYYRHSGSIMADTFSQKSGMSKQHLQIGILFYHFLKKRNLFFLNKNYMAKILFSYLDFSLRHEDDLKEKENIIKLALDFIHREKWEHLSWSADIRHQIQSLIFRTDFREVKIYFGGLIKVEKTSNYKKIFFAGVSVWRIIYSGNIKKYFLLKYIYCGKKYNKALISVLMPVYNGEKYIKEAINSILSQTYKNFEFIIINDGSTDNTANIVCQYKDPRIVFIDNNKNQGISAVLNEGLNLCRGEFIARMDADDISLPNRLKKQIRFMSEHEDIGVAGTLFNIFGDGIDKIEHKLKYPNLVDMIPTSPVGHPTAMLRKSIFDQYNLRYNAKYKHCEDYELWTRVIKFTKIANLQEVLLKYRWHEENVSSTHEKEQLFNSELIKIRIKKQCDYAPEILEIPIDDANLLSELWKLGAFDYMPNSGNMGDMLIAGATMDWFDKNNLNWERAKENSYPRCFVYGGGGGWLHEWIEYMRPTMEIMKNAERIVILPSSFNDVPEFIEILDERFTVFCREKKSYDYLIGANTKAQIYLDHDMVLRMTNYILKRKLIPSENLEKISGKLIKKVSSLSKQVRFFRKDSESVGNYATDLDLSDQLSWFSQFESRDNIDFAAKTMLEIMWKFETVKTDRLHVGIAAALTGADVCLFDNNYGKLSGVYNQSLSGLPNVQFDEAGVNK